MKIIANTGLVSLVAYGVEEVPRLTSHIVKPHGRLPWFVTASQALADRIGHGNGSKDENASIRTADSNWKYQDRLGSNRSDRELQTVNVQPPLTDPSQEKVLRKW